MLRDPRPLLYIAIVLAVLNLVRKAEPEQQLPLIKADMPYCFAIKNPPLELVTPKHEAHPRMPDNA